MFFDLCAFAHELGWYFNTDEALNYKLMGFVLCLKLTERTKI